ncbi:MAG: L-threonylcarbamoyladenylate synthase [Treponema sp.]|nr:L-threonylcarbamoyladenylate synthase [Treponema sp.]
MTFLPVSPEAISKGAQIIKAGGLTAFPTETVYGLGADAFNPQALAKIFEVKKRPFFDPLIIHIAALSSLEITADLSLLNNEARKTLFLLAENLWPGPLSIVLPKNKKIPAIASAGLSTSAIRFPDNETAQKLITLSSGAVAAPSANPFGSLSPTKAEHVRDSLGEKIDLIIDGGPARIGLESTVLDITENRVKILRPGGTTKEAIESLLKIKLSSEEKSSIPDPSINIPASPGQLKSHYAPQTPLVVLKSDEIINKKTDAEEKTALLFFDGGARDAWRAANKIKGANVIVKTLSESGDLLQAASCFFETLHELDACNVCRIYAQLAPQTGLGEAINDRLHRASALT